METITRDTDRDFFMSPQEAIEVGPPARRAGLAGLAALRASPPLCALRGRHAGAVPPAGALAALPSARRAPLNAPPAPSTPLPPPH